MTSGDRLLDILRLLQDELIDIADGHPLGHLLPGRGESIELGLRLPLDREDARLGKARDRLRHALDAGLAGVLSHRASFVPGRVFCLRCRQATCGHAVPADARHIFAGYSPSGVPRFVDLGQWLLERRDPRVEALYDDTGPLVTRRSDEAELTERLLPAFRDHRDGFRLHGQVAAGWYRVASESGRAESFAITLQVVSSGCAAGRSRFGLNVIGVGPRGEELERLHHRLGSMPWGPAVRWAQSVLDQIGKQHSSRRRRSGDKLGRRIDGLLSGLCRRLEHRQRSTKRRTRHAEHRHEEGTRPTRMALTDLSRAGADSLFIDEKRKTVVVVGERGRTHVFNDAGKLVTSIRYQPGAVEGKVRKRLWRPASAAEREGLRRRLGVTREDPGAGQEP